MNLSKLRKMNGCSWNKSHSISESPALPGFQLFFHKHQLRVLAVLLHHAVAIRNSVRCIAAEHNVLQQQPVVTFGVKTMGKCAKRSVRLPNTLARTTEQRCNVGCARGYGRGC